MVFIKQFSSAAREKFFQARKHSGVLQSAVISLEAINTCMTNLISSEELQWKIISEIFSNFFLLWGCFQVIQPAGAKLKGSFGRKVAETMGWRGARDKNPRFPADVTFGCARS